MREIKFRIFDEKSKNMLVQGTPDLETLSSFMFHYGDNKHLMQHTGLKDKNGVEICEGDIVSYDHGVERISICEIEYRESESQFQCRYGASYFRLGSLVSRCVAKNIEVIGNIYENKELLENN